MPAIQYKSWILTYWVPDALLLQLGDMWSRRILDSDFTKDLISKLVKFEYVHTTAKTKATNVINHLFGQIELSPTNKKYHLQACLQMKDKITKKSLLYFMHYPDLCHMDPCSVEKDEQGKAKKIYYEESMHYCSKPHMLTRVKQSEVNPNSMIETVTECMCKNCVDERRTPTKVSREWEFGTAIKQGARTDIKTFYDVIKEGKSDIELFDQFPREYVKFYKAVDRVRMLKPVKRDRPLGIFVYGDSSTYKTTSVYQVLSVLYPNSVFHKPFGMWWDGYSGQKAIIIDDYRGELEITYFLRLFDGTPNLVQIKGGSVYINPLVIVITSNMTPNQMAVHYSGGSDKAPDTIEAVPGENYMQTQERMQIAQQTRKTIDKTGQAFLNRFPVFLHAIGKGKYDLVKDECPECLMPQGAQFDISEGDITQMTYFTSVFRHERFVRHLDNKFMAVNIDAIRFPSEIEALKQAALLDKKVEDDTDKELLQELVDNYPEGNIPDPEFDYKPQTTIPFVLPLSNNIQRIPSVPSARKGLSFAIRQDS